MLLKLSNLNSNLALALGYLNPALNNSAQRINYNAIDLRPDWTLAGVSPTFPLIYSLKPPHIRLIRWTFSIVICLLKQVSLESFVAQLDISGCFVIRASCLKRTVTPYMKIMFPWFYRQTVAINSNVKS